MGVDSCSPAQSSPEHVLEWCPPSAGVDAAGRVRHFWPAAPGRGRARCASIRVLVLQMESKSTQNCLDGQLKSQQDETHVRSRGAEANPCCSLAVLSAPTLQPIAGNWACSFMPTVQLFQLCRLKEVEV